MSQALLDYNELGLRQFLPGARVKLRDGSKLAAVSDPLRRKRDVWKAISSPVGSFMDKLRLAPLFYTVVTKSTEELFAMDEIDTMSCLRGYGFSEEFIESFFAPFLEGIYLTSLEKQSSRMFHFVFKMFTLGSASLPKGGMQTVADQLGKKARSLGVDMFCDTSVRSIQQKDGKFTVNFNNQVVGTTQLCAKSVILATNERVANQLLSNIIEPISVPPLAQRTVACIYYGLPSPAPLLEPVLILNGEGSTKRNVKGHPINNVCFPSVVQSSYAPNGFELCSISILEKALNEYNGNYEALDIDVRRQLASWFPEHASNILDPSIWVQKETYAIQDAQPAHFDEENCANVHGGRDCTIFRNEQLPDGLYVCGDYMATSTFNGALESGVNAGNAAAKYLDG
jgi:phytoene dehydrogenase-like protein